MLMSNSDIYELYFFSHKENRKEGIGFIEWHEIIVIMMNRAVVITWLKRRLCALKLL